jgi:PAS domain S-box-containing protein
MRHKIILSLLAIFVFFAIGAAVAVIYITQTPMELNHLIELHQIESLKRNLVNNVQTVQSDLYSVRTPLAHKLDSIVNNVSQLEDAANNCSSCHHSPVLTKKIKKVQELIQNYQDEMSRYITASANRARIEKIGLRAVALANKIFVESEEMSLKASKKLGYLTGKALNKIKVARIVLIITLISVFILGLLVSINLTRSVTKPVKELVNATRMIARGSLGHEISYKGNREFGELAKNFNVMSTALKEGYNNLEAANIELQQEITVRKQAEKKIEKAYNMTHSILEKSPFGIYVVNNDGTIEYANPAMLKISGTEIKQFIGINVFEFPIYRECGIDKKIRAALQGKFFYLGGVKYTSHYGNKYTTRNFTGIPFDEENKKKALIFVEDITEREKLEEQLRQAQKMEAIGTLTGGIAHEFNNIITAITASAELLLARVPKDDRIRKYPKIIHTSALRAANLTQSLLAYSRKQVTNMQLLSIDTVLDDIKGIIPGIIGEDIRVEIENTDDEIKIMADSNQVEQVLMNLVTNARDAMPDGGKLTIKTKRAEIDDEFIKKYGYGKPGLYSLISVADTGVGIDKPAQAKIFEPFFTTKEVGKGTGLGLSIVYGIVKRHNGYINVESEPGKGSIFYIYLPIIKAGVKQRKKKVKPVHIDGTETILLAEDDTNVRQLLGSFLEEAGYKVIEAINGEDAIKKFMAHKDAVQLFLSDVIMPVKNGKEAYAEIEKVKPGLKVIYISGYNDNLIYEKGISSTEQNFIHKPVSRQELLERLRNVLDS